MPRGQPVDQLLDPRALAGDVDGVLAPRLREIIEEAVELGIEAMFAVEAHGGAPADGGKRAPMILAKPAFSFLRRIVCGNSRYMINNK